MTKEQFLKLCKRQENGCLLWWGKQQGDGYGYFYIDGKQIRAHRYALHLWTGFDLNSSLDVLHDDSICTSKLCCEYTHLRPGTHEENYTTVVIRSANAEKTHCIHGHEFTKENTYKYDGYRYCKTCRAIRDKEATRKRKLRRKRSS